MMFDSKRILPEKVEFEIFDNLPGCLEETPCARFSESYDSFAGVNLDEEIAIYG